MARQKVLKLKRLSKRDRVADLIKAVRREVRADMEAGRPMRRINKPWCPVSKTFIGGDF